MECNLVCPEIIRVILKSDDAQRKFDLKSQQRLRPKLHDTKFNYHFITAILKSQNSVSTNTKKKRLLHLILYSRQKRCDKGKKWCDLKLK